MPNRILAWSESVFHSLVPNETRTKIYLRSPAVVRRVWDELGNKAAETDTFSIISENDVLFSIRFFWFHEPSVKLVRRWFEHAVHFNFNLNGLVHQLQNSPEALEFEPILKESQVPIDTNYVYYAYRLLLRREPTAEEHNKWLEKLQKTKWLLGSFVSHFEKTAEYQYRLKVEAEPHLVELDQYMIYVRLGDYFTSAHIAHTRAYEPHIGILIGRIVRAGDYVIDVGANVGYHALHMASIVGGRGKVFAFEPNPGNCELIKLSSEANHFDNVVLFPHAAGNVPGDIELLVEGNHTNARLYLNPNFDSPTARRYPVKVVKIDDCLAGISRLRFVKIDVEGAEPLAVAGMSELISRHRPILLFEFFPDYIRRTSQIDPKIFLDQIFDYGYRLYVVDAMSKLTEVLDSSQVLHLHEESGSTHVDILALPAESQEPIFSWVS